MSEVRVNNLSNENNTGGPTISGITTYSGRHFFVPPQGDTASRPSDCEPGSLRFNTDTAHLEYFRGNTIGWTEIEAEDVEMGGVSGSSGSIDGKGTRAIFAGGYTPSAQPNSTFNNVDALTIDTLGNSIDFNNLTSSRAGACQFSDSTRAMAAGGVGPVVSQYSTIVNTIEFCTFSTTGDYADFGDLTIVKRYLVGLASRTRGLFYSGSPGPGTHKNTIDYITIQTKGNAINFGDMTTSGNNGGSLHGSNLTRSVNYAGSNEDEIEYVTITTLGNTQDFGDITVARVPYAGLDLSLIHI